jgi:hypothetical protein
VLNLSWTITIIEFRDFPPMRLTHQYPIRVLDTKIKSFINFSDGNYFFSSVSRNVGGGSECTENVDDYS